MLCLCFTVISSFTFLVFWNSQKCRNFSQKMFYYCMIALLTCSLAYRQPMETWRLRWCVSSGGVTSQATLILWLTVMQVSRKMRKREPEHTRVISELIVGLCQKVQRHTRPPCSRPTKYPCIDLSIAKIGQF